MGWWKEHGSACKDIAYVASLVLIPVALGVGSWWIQSSIAEAATKKEYLQLALEGLRMASDRKDADAKKLREWSVDMINTYAPIRFTEEAAQGFSSGNVGGPYALHAEADMGFYYPHHSSSSDCAQYYIITDDKNGFAACLARLREIRDATRELGNQIFKVPPP
jgi:hypothetical protein